MSNPIDDKERLAGPMYDLAKRYVQFKETKNRLKKEKTKDLNKIHVEFDKKLKRARREVYKEKRKVILRAVEKTRYKLKAVENDLMAVSKAIEGLGNKKLFTRMHVLVKLEFEELRKNNAKEVIPEPEPITPEEPETLNS